MLSVDTQLMLIYVRIILKSKIFAKFIFLFKVKKEKDNLNIRHLLQ